MVRWALYRFVHTSWLIAIACVSLVIGVWLAQFITVFLPWWIVALLCVFLVFSLWRQRVIVIPLVVLCGVGIGLWRGGIDTLQQQLYAPLYGNFVELSGTVYEDVTFGAGGSLSVALNNIRVKGHSLVGVIRVQLAAQVPIARGDNITVEGKFQEGFGAFVGAMYRPKLIDVKRPNPGDIGRRVRDWFAEALRSVVDEPQASLGLGFLLGQKSALPDDLADAMRVAGLTHIVVASGYNLTILVRFARRLFLKISRFAAAITASFMVLSFMAITGMSPSMSRAGLVAGLSLGAWYVGRSFHPIVLLSIAAGVTVLVQPSYAWGDVGWQLSFAAFAGVMLLAPILQNYFFGDAKPGMMRQLLGETISAHLATLPIIIATFGQLSHIAIIANMLVVPLVPFAMLATFIVGTVSLIWQPAAEFLSTPLEWLLGYMVNVAMFLSELPWATSEIALPGWAMAALYSGMVIIGVWLWRASKTNLRQTSIVE